MDAERRAFLLARLRELYHGMDTEDAHVTADRLLLDYISDPEITEAYAKVPKVPKVPKWYA